MKAINIKWDTDGEIVDLPNEIEIPEGMSDEEEVSDYISNVTGFCHKGFSLNKILVIPANVCIKRFYRVYAHVNKNVTDEEIRKAIIEAILDNQDEELTDDPDMEIEEGDIEYVDIDHEGEWTEEGEEIRRILK